VWFGETSRLLEGGIEGPELQPQGHGLQPESGRLAALGGGERAPGRRGAAGAGRGARSASRARSAVSSHWSRTRRRRRSEGRGAGRAPRSGLRRDRKPWTQRSTVARRRGPGARRVEEVPAGRPSAGAGCAAGGGAAGRAGRLPPRAAGRALVERRGATVPASRRCAGYHRETRGRPRRSRRLGGAGAPLRGGRGAGAPSRGGRHGAGRRGRWGRPERRAAGRRAVR